MRKKTIDIQIYNGDGIRASSLDRAFEAFEVTTISGHKELNVFVPGEAVSKGSMRAFLPRGSSRPVITHASGSKLGAWQNRVHDRVRSAMEADGLSMISSGPVEVSLRFFLRRPLSHFRKKKGDMLLREDAPTYAPAGRDGDKLERAVWDALTGLAFRDDRQVAQWRGEKRYAREVREGGEVGVEIEVRGGWGRGSDGEKCESQKIEVSHTEVRSQTEDRDGG